jgi:hypothetical protein
VFLDEETLLQKETYVKSAEKIFVFLDEYLSESPLCCSVCANRMSVIAIIRDPRDNRIQVFTAPIPNAGFGDVREGFKFVLYMALRFMF